MGQSFIRKHIGFNTLLSRHQGDRPLSMGEKPRRGLPVLLFLMLDAPLLSSFQIALVRTVLNKLCKYSPKSSQNLRPHLLSWASLR